MATETREGWHSHYENSYSATVFDSFEGLSSVFVEFCEGDIGYLNVPVWVDFDGEGRLAVGIMFPCHGDTTQWIAPATPDQVRDIQSRMLRVWAGRAEAHFDRYNAKYAPIN